MKKTKNNQNGSKAKTPNTKGQKSVTAKSSTEGQKAKKSSANGQKNSQTKSTGKGQLAMRIKQAQWQAEQDRKDRNSSDPQGAKRKPVPQSMSA